MKRVLAVTMGRSDFGIFRPVFEAISKSDDLQLQVVVSGMHMSPEFGLTRSMVEDSGFEVVAFEDVLLSSDSAAGTAKSMGMTCLAFANVYAQHEADYLMVLGDRFETFAATAASVPFRIPVVHLHGGEITEGATDDMFRHAITKMSHLHFVATPEYRDRVVQLGEEPWRVVHCGAPSLDSLTDFVPMSREAFSRKFGELPETFILATYHPVTTQLGTTEAEFEAFLGAVEAFGMPCILTMANADAYGRRINKKAAQAAAQSKFLRLVPNLGSYGYFSALHYSHFVAGNSSSGIIEAASFGRPVVDVGDRQRGRSRGSNVIHVDGTKDEILGAFVRASHHAVAKTFEGLLNPYGTGNAAQKIVEVLESAPSREALLDKRFHDICLNGIQRADEDV